MSAGEDEHRGGRPPDVTDAVLGFRIWSLRLNGRLGAIVAGSIWEPGVNEAACNPGARIGSRQRHRAPYPGCGCGFNAYFSPKGRLSPGSNEVLGAIAAWGEMDVYATGFRAQYAQVIALAQPTGGRGAKASTERLHLAAEQYGVPLVPVAELQAEALRHASPLSPVMLPTEPPRKRRGRSASTPAAPQPPALRPVATVATWQIARGHAIWVRRHVTTNALATGVELGLAPGAAAVADPDPDVRVAPLGARVEAGDCVASVAAAYPDRRVHLCTPVAGRVRGHNARFAAQLLDGDRAISSAPWVIEVEPDPSPLEDAPLLWGRPGVEIYRRSVARQSDADVLAELAAPLGFDDSEFISIAPGSTRGLPSLAAHQRRRTSRKPEDGRRAAIMVEHLRPLLQACGEEGTLLAA